MSAHRMTGEHAGTPSRRQFLRLVAGAAAAATGAACGSGSAQSAKPAARRAAGRGARTLQIAQWSHYIPAYDAWFDGYAGQWGREHEATVVVDHIPYAQLRSRADAEVAGGSGHDVFAFILPPPGLEDHVIDHREIVEEVEARLGPMAPLVERSILNPRTGRYFGFSDFWAPNPVNYRSDLWDGHGFPAGPATWDDLLVAGPSLRAGGHPLGIGMGPDHDSNTGLLALMAAYGASVQDEAGTVTLDRPTTVEALEVGAALFRTAMTEDVLAWDAASDNRVLAGDKTALILDPPSALRAIEKQDGGMAARIGFAALPAGPAGRLGCHALVNVYVIMGFSNHQDLAKEFLADLALVSRQGFLHSESYNLPSFPGAAPDLAALLSGDAARPAGKYTVLAGAAEWSVNVGHPGHDNAAIEEIFHQHVIPEMFAAVATGRMTAGEAARAAAARTEVIFAAWRDRGKI